MDEEKTIPVFIIADWNRCFENAKSRTVDLKSYGQFMLKQGRGYCRMMMEKDGAAIYGTFIALAGIAQSKHKPREGYLTQTGNHHGYPLSFEDMAAITRIPVKTIKRALTVLSSRAVGWIVADIMEIPQGYLEDTSISEEYSKYTGIVPTVSTVHRAGAEKKTSGEEEPKPAIKLPYSSPAFLESWAGLMEVRKEKKAVNSDTAIKLLIAKIKKIAPSESEAIRQINRAIENSWKTVYPDNDFGNKNGSDPEAIRKIKADREAKEADRMRKVLERQGVRVPDMGLK